MPLFKVDHNKLSSIREMPFDLEKDIQAITEQNLDKIFDLRFVTTEFALNNLRIDTLAFDDDLNAFVIIEYKRDKSFSVIDQGYAYLSLMLNNKADFVLEFNEKQDKQIKKDDVDWSQTRVVFISNSFTKYQKQAVSFKDLPIELWEVKKYENGDMLYNKLESPDASESINTISKKSETIHNVSKEVKVYTTDDHIRTDWNDSRKLYENLREKIMEVDDRIEESPQKYYIGFKIDEKLLVAVKVQKTRLILELLRVQPQDLKDPEKKLSYKENSFKYYNKHITQLFIENDADIAYGLSFIKELKKKFFEPLG